MTPLLLHQLWTLVETTQAQLLLSLDDNSLVQFLIGQLRGQRSINHQESDTVTTYLYSRLTLIRDLAQER
ncbi:hypothetical protein H6F67_14370 [Microcoleus sp. FACHB-1515]|uniref:hypothetical protein n=1 Tax=Cyanophyceae TaxID=3028117 RepID=UPI001689970E|nr:hypothetical protein [Microcoleus sp. FACHB-1515]MBD2091037.1 hypothetical protein [Microcoleus sp. FACHB-1515]